MLENRPATLQVQGLNTEYERLRKESESKGAAKGGASGIGEGPTNVQGLRKEIQSLQVPQPSASFVLLIECLQAVPATVVLINSKGTGSVCGCGKGVMLCASHQHHIVCLTQCTTVD